MDSRQLDLFADRASVRGASTPPIAPPLDPASLSDAALIAALPEVGLADAGALAAEAGRRGLSGAVRALATLCHRFTGFGADRTIPEQAAALDALAEIGGSEASRSVEEMVVKAIVQGPTLAAAVAAASRLGVAFAAAAATRLLRHPDPSVRAAACACARAGPEVVTVLTELLLDRDREVAIAAACALGRMGSGKARDPLKRLLNEGPSARVIEALSGVADEEAVVFLARIGRARPEFAAAVLAALDEIDPERAPAAAAALRRWFSLRR
jgi:hypothetical protein